MLSNISLTIKNHFVEIFKYSLKNNQEISFENILDKTLSNLQIEKYDQREILNLKNWFEDIYELKFLEKIIESGFQEVILHSNNNGQIIFHGQNKESFNPGIIIEDWELLFDVIVIKNHLEFNFTNPFASIDFNLFEENFRLTLVHFSITSLNQSKLFLRMPHKNSFKLDSFLEDEKLFHFFHNAYVNKKNIIIAGSTGSGKTSFLECFINHQKSDDHIIVLEDTSELSLSNHQATYLLSRNEKNKELKDYCAYAMRLSPDRMVLGEMRGAEIISYVLLMNTGHNGMLSTIHANSCKDAILRMGLLFSLHSESTQIKSEDIMKLLTQNIDYVVFLKNKRVSEIIEVVGSQANQPIYDVIYNSSST